ncbi:MAG: hypothetical protein V1809_10945 [Planctomycetota bacterium]
MFSIIGRWGTTGMALVAVWALGAAGGGPVPLFPDADKIEGKVLDAAKEGKEPLDAFRQILSLFLQEDAKKIAARARFSVADLDAKTAIGRSKIEENLKSLFEKRDFAAVKTVEDLVDLPRVRILGAASIPALATPEMKKLYSPGGADALVVAPSTSDLLGPVVVFLIQKGGTFAAWGGVLRGDTVPARPAGSSSKGKGGGAGMGKVTVNDSYYFYCVPKDYRDDVPWPLVVHCHGAGSSPDDSGNIAGEYRKWGPVAGEKNFLWIGVKSRDNTRWGADDEANITAAIRDAKIKWNVLLPQVYMSGFSAGGWMASRYATGPEGGQFAALCCFCFPFQGEAYRGAKAGKFPAYFASNKGDFNWGPTQEGQKTYNARRHLTTFVDESAHVNGHRIDVQSCKDAWEWFMKNARPGKP